MDNLMEFFTSGWVFAAVATILTFILTKKVKVDIPKIKNGLSKALLLIDEAEDVLRSIEKAITDNPNTKKDEGAEFTKEEIEEITKEIKEFVDVLPKKKKDIK